MTSYRDFCRHYGLDPNTDDARRQYQEAEDNLKALYSASARDQVTEAIDQADQATGNQEGER